jgi:hypothetical protein
MQDTGTKPPTLYETDFYAWTGEQAALLRAGRFAEADIANIVEEIETLGRSEKRELVSRLAVLLMHLLKWQYQPKKRGKSWRLTAREQRRSLLRHLRDNPSLRARLPETITDAYGDACIKAALEINQEPEAFPATCPWSWDEITDDNFWPEG